MEEDFTINAMNKILFILFLLPCFVFGQTTDATLTTQAQQIKNETVAGANTANRVGTHLQNLVYSKKSFFVDGTASGTDTYSVTLDNGAITALTSQWFVIKFTNGNTGAATLNINAIGAKSLVKTDGSALSSGDIDAGSVHLLSYDGTNLQVLSLGGGGGAGISDGDKGDITVSGSGSTWNIDAGVIGTTELATAYKIDQASASTAGATITLDCNSQIQRSFVGSATFATPKTLALSNTTNTLFFNVYLEVTDVAAVLTVPADWLMSIADFDGDDWNPPAVGKYEFGGSFDDTNNVWYVKVSGPFN